MLRLFFVRAAQMIDIRRAVFVAVVAASATRLGAQAMLTGIVKEDSSGKVLTRVEVRLEGTDRQAWTDSAGRYTLSAKKGEYVAMFRWIGYQPSRVRVTLVDGDTTQVDATLVPTPAQQLDTVAVTAAPVVRTMREAIVERKKLGLGKFIDAEELRKYDARATSDFLRSMGVRMVPFHDCSPWYKCPEEMRAAHPLKSVRDGAPACWATVIYDNVTIYRSGTRARPPDFRRDFQSSTLEAIEYYKNAAQMPVEFASKSGDCGVIVLWSRRD